MQYVREIYYYSPNFRAQVYRTTIVDVRKMCASVRKLVIFYLFLNQFAWNLNKWLQDVIVVIFAADQNFVGKLLPSQKSSQTSVPDTYWFQCRNSSGLGRGDRKNPSVLSVNIPLISFSGLAHFNQKRFGRRPETKLFLHFRPEKIVNIFARYYGTSRVFGALRFRLIRQEPFSGSSRTFQDNSIKLMRK